MRPESIQPAKHFWKIGARQCVLYIVNGSFEVRLLEHSNVVNTAICRDGGHADATAREWLARRPLAVTSTPCPRCGATETRHSNRTDAFVYLRCTSCREVWRIPERRASARIAAGGAVARLRPSAR
jgi:hypothetical protein